MDRKKLFKDITFLILFIFVLNSLASKFYWYSSIWWFDMPMHFMGGLWVGLALIWLLSLKNLSFSSTLSVIVGVFVVGVLWEFFELYFINHIAEHPFNLLDTISDIFFDLSGGCLALVYFSKRTMTPAENAVHPVVEL